MFAYCGNNPIVRKDTSGEIWAYNLDMQVSEYEVDEVETTVVNEEDGKTTYRTTIIYTEILKYKSFHMAPWSEITYSHKASFEYTVTSNGVILFDNRQGSVPHLDVVPVRDALAKEMLNATKKQVEGALQLRTATGISRELDLHYKLYRIGVLPDSTKVSNIGGMGGIGNDSNAWVFEVIFRW